MRGYSVKQLPECNRWERRLRSLGHYDIPRGNFSWPSVHGAILPAELMPRDLVSTKPEKIREVFSKLKPATAGLISEFRDGYESTITKALCRLGADIDENIRAVSVGLKQRAHFNAWKRYLLAYMLENNSIPMKESVARINNELPFKYIGVNPKRGSLAMRFLSNPIMIVHPVGEQSVAMYMGRALINLKLSDNRVFTGVDIEPAATLLHPVSPTVGGVFYPHVRGDGVMCFGDYLDQVSHARTTCDIFTVLELVRGGIFSYGDSPWRQPLQYWVEFSRDIRWHTRGVRGGAAIGSVALEIASSMAAWSAGHVEGALQRSNDLCFAAFEADLEGVDILDCPAEEVLKRYKRGLVHSYSNVTDAKKLVFAPLVDPEEAPAIRSETAADTAPDFNTSGLFANASLGAVRYNRIVNRGNLMWSSRYEEEFEALMKREDVIIAVQRPPRNRLASRLNVLFKEPLTLECLSLDHILGFMVEVNTTPTSGPDNIRVHSIFEGSELHTIHPYCAGGHVQWCRPETSMEVMELFYTGRINTFVNTVIDRLQTYDPTDALYTIDQYTEFLNNRILARNRG